MNQRRLLTLDAMRGVAAVIVVFMHLPVFTRFVPRSGFLAVDFFFMLSGFVLARAYGDQLRDGLRIRDFAKRRLIRLYPLYAVGMFLGLIVRLWQVLATLPRALTPTQIAEALAIESFLLPSQVTNSLFTLNGPAWSLFFEWAVNLLYAVALVRLRIGLQALVAVLAARVLAWMGYTAGSFNLGFNWQSVPIGMARTLFAFTVGAIIAKLHRTDVQVSWFALVLPVALAAVLIIRPSHLVGVYTLGAIVFAAPALVWFGACVNPPAPLVALSRVLGDLSYAIYAIHAPLVLLFYFGAMALNVPQRIWLAVFFATLALVAVGLDKIDIRVRRGLSRLLGDAQPKPLHLRPVAAIHHVPIAADRQTRTQLPLK